MLRLWQLAAERGAPADLGLQLGQQRGLQSRGPVANLAAMSATPVENVRADIVIEFLPPLELPRSG